MNSIRVIALLSCVGLLSIIGWQLQATWVLASALQPSRGPVYMPAPTTSAASEPALARDWMKTALGRPLLRETRRPDKVDKFVGDGRPPRLAGIVTGPSGKRAIFMPDQGKPVSLTEGERLGKFLVRSIDSSQVVVETDNGSDAMRPRFKS